MDVKCFFRTVSKVAKDESVVEGSSRENKERNDGTETINGRRILFFSPAFFGYEDKIVKKMQDMGAEVDSYDVRSVTSARDRALLKDNHAKKYDYILIVKCDMTPELVLKKMKTDFPTAKLCLYLWDSVANIPGIEKKFKYFDAIHSFDLGDCKRYEQLIFRPLFYADEFCKNSMKNHYRYDISFTGTIHSDRYKIISEIKKICFSKKLKCFWFCYLQSEFVYYFYKLTKKEFRTTKVADFDLNKIDSSQIAKIVDDSKIVLDIQHPNQTGLTMRTIEMIGMNKKIITTNSSIKQYDFYNPINVSVIERNNVIIDDAFINSSYEPLKDDIYKRYSLQNWILEVLS